ncbi:MAG TPA: lipocalin-like domain-containing protein [Candidatus Methylomirabilis sp.]|nr:lipocalin-like domain-containing protein [Candidatus Methylomirabilis sp.]
MRSPWLVHPPAIAVAVLLLLSSNAPGQQKSRRDQLVGVWVLARHETTLQDGSKRQQFGANPKGMVILDASGNYTQILVHPDLPKFRSSDRRQGTTEENAATVRGSVANFGIWTVDEAGKTLTYHIVGSTFPNQAGTEMKTVVSLGGDEWTSTIPRTTSGRESVMVWKRVK